jgi:hypothetical protein
VLCDGGDAWSYAHLIAVIFSLDPTIISIMDPMRARFENALAHIGFGPGERDTFVQASGCVNACMMGLLSPKQVLGICKRLATRNVNPVALMAIQEHLLLALRFWVVKQQRLQLTMPMDYFTTALALNQAQEMR